MQPHIVAFAFPFASHTGSLLSIIAKLAAAAPTATFSFFTTTSARTSLPRAMLSLCEQLPNLHMCALPDDGVVPEGFVPQRGLEELVDMFMNAAPDVCRQAMEGLTLKPAPTCVVADLLMFCAGLMAEEMELPWVGVWTPCCMSLLAHTYTDIILKTIGVGQEIQAKLDDRLDFIPCMSSFFVRDLPEQILYGSLDFTFPLTLKKMGQAWLRAAALVLNTFDGLESNAINHIQSISKNLVLPLGPLPLLAPVPAPESDPHGSLLWLDKIAQPHSVVYITFGTAFLPPLVELVALAEALESSGDHFLWSLKEEVWPKLPLGFLKRTTGKGLVVPWAPQTMVLAHAAVGAVFTHSGWNSVLESIISGLPIISRPLSADNHLNGRMLSDMWGIGVGFDGGIITTEGAVKALDLVLNKEEGKKMRKNVNALKELALQAVNRGGSSSKSFDALLELVLKGKLQHKECILGKEHRKIEVAYNQLG